MIPPGAVEITTGQANRVWRIDAPTPYILKHYRDPARAANEAAALDLLAANNIDAPRLLASGLHTHPAWTAQSIVRGFTQPPEQFPDNAALPLTAIHAIRGPHAGRLAGAPTYPTWRGYLLARVGAYGAACPELGAHIAESRIRLAVLPADIPLRLLHHDLQPAHLLVHTRGAILIDWELAVFGDPLSDAARAAVRLRLQDPRELLDMCSDWCGSETEARILLYWKVHLLADAALASDVAVAAYARGSLARAGW